MGVLLSKKKNKERHGFQVTEDENSESQRSSEDEKEPKSDDDHSDNEEKDESKSDQEESASEDNEDKKSRSSSSASSEKSKSSQEDEGVEEEKDEDIEIEEGSVKDVVSARTEVNLSYEKRVEKALVGDMNFEYPEQAKIVRIFTSSTFTGIFVSHWFIK